MIAHGELQDTLSWATSMNYKVLEYISKSKENTDWPLVARRLELTTQYTGHHSNPFLLLGNAYVMTGNTEKAIIAYGRSVENMHGEDPNKTAIREHIEKLKNASDPLSVGILRPYFLE